MTDLLISKEDLDLLHERDYHLVFCIGPIGSGKKSEIGKISSEFRFSKLFLSERINQEISSKSKLGLLAQEFISKNEPISAQVIVAILVRGIVECSEESILIVGFPEKLEHAQYFEQNILNINLILKFNCPEEICYKRLCEEMDFKKSKEEYSIIYSNTQNDLKEVFDFYNPYSVIREIDTNKPIPEMNKTIKQNLYPLIFCIIGKRYSGKTTLSKIINEKSGIKLLDFGKFLLQPDIIKRKHENEFVVNQLILKLRKIQTYKILIEDFPQNKEQYVYFVNNCQPFKQIFYLKAENSSCFERVNKIPLEDENYTDCSVLDKMLTEFENKQPFIDFLKKSTNVLEIDVNNHINLTIERMLKQIQPYCVYFSNDIDEESKTELFNKLKTNYKFSEISLPEIISNAIKRNILENKKNEPIDKINLTLEQKINLIRPLLYREDCKNIILNSFPSTIEELTEFENKLFSINKFVQLTTKKKLGTITDVNSMAVHFYKKNLLLSFNPKNSSDYKLEEILDMTRDINIIYGMPQSGKTTFAKYLKEKYSFELLDFKELIEKVKKSKIDPENPDAEPEITFQDLINYLKNLLKNDSFFAKKKILLENFFIQNSPEPFLIDTYEKAAEIVKMFGKFRNFYEIELEEKTLINKYKQKEGITEELSEDQKASFLETLDKPKKLVEDIRQISENVIKINTISNKNVRYKNYIVFNKNIITYNKTYFYDKDDNLLININDSFEFQVIINDDDKYGIIFNDRLFFIKKENVVNEFENINTFEKNTSGISVLNYHFIYKENEICDSGIICMSQEQFEKHLQYIKENDFFTPTLTELEYYIDGKINLPKSVVITADDGYFGENFKELLEKYQLNGTLFLITGWYDASNFVSDYMEIHSHGDRLHSQNICPGGQGGAIKCLNYDDLILDLKTSRDKLNGSKYFAYPFYEYNDYSIKALKDSGFTMAFGGEYENNLKYVKPGVDKFRLPRWVMVNYTTMNKFENYLNLLG